MESNVGVTSSAPSSNTGRSQSRSKFIPVETKPPDKPPSSLLDDRMVADRDELYSDNERALTEFLRLHPMLSLEATSTKTLSCIAAMIGDTDLQVPEPELVSKTHDDQFLRRADKTIGERDCLLGDKCICKWISVFRFGEETDKAFVCKEWLLPSQLETFQNTGKLPPQQQKCLVCTRYFSSYIYHMARTCPTFKCQSQIQLQLFANQVHECVPANDVMPIANESGTVDGYRPDVLLYVDEAFSSTAASREGLAQLLFQPIVRFKSSDYDFVKDTDGQWMLTQHKLGTQYFRDPASLTDVRTQDPD